MNHKTLEAYCIKMSEVKNIESPMYSSENVLEILFAEDIVLYKSVLIMFKY